jgi:hypothetical protein
MLPGQVTDELGGISIGARVSLAQRQSAVQTKARILQRGGYYPTCRVEPSMEGCKTNVSYPNAASALTASTLVLPGGSGWRSRARAHGVSIAAARASFAPDTHTASADFWAASRRFPGRPRTCATTRPNHVAHPDVLHCEPRLCAPRGSLGPVADQASVALANAARVIASDQVPVQM